MLHRYVAGIQLRDDDAAGYRQFTIAPKPGGGITSARAVHDCPYGRIEASWRINGDRLHLDIVVPAGTSADVHLPDGQQFHAKPGSTRYEGQA